MKQFDVGLLIKIINEYIEKKSNQDLKPWGITVSQMRILGYVKHRQEMGIATSQKDIENHLEVSHPTVVGVLKNLKQKGIIQTQCDSEDKRIKRVYITKKEELFHQDLVKSKKDMEEKIIKDFTETEKAELIRLLLKIKQNIHNI